MSFNSYTIKGKTIGGGNVVWRKVNAVLQSGVSIPKSELAEAKIIPAGTPVAYRVPGDECAIIRSNEDFNKCNGIEGCSFGFILNDVVIEAPIVGEDNSSATILATASVVIDGELYAQRVDNTQVLKVGALCPKITLLLDVPPAEAGPAAALL